MIPPQGFGETGGGGGGINETRKQMLNLFLGGHGNKEEYMEEWIQEITCMEGCGGKDEQSNLFKGNNDTGSIIVLISLQSKPTRSVDKVFVCRSRDHNSKSMVINPPPQS